MAPRRHKLSAFVISCNRAGILATCLKTLSFADELIVVDKSSSDGSREIAEARASRVVVVPWSPTVEETRAEALSLCSHDWILFLDDDECLSPAAARFIESELVQPRAKLYSFPFRNYRWGVHDERAHYWPEHHVRLFRRGALSFSGKVHRGIRLKSDEVLVVPPDDGICIHHLTHPTVESSIERINRYTSRPQRAGIDPGTTDLAELAHERIEFWLSRSRLDVRDDYLVAVALQRAVYDMVDALKRWEERRPESGEALTAAVCRAIEAEFDEDRRGEPQPARPQRPDRLAGLLRRGFRRVR